ncbi:hypothetical protein D3C72_1011880 [compost metagenome]
MSVTFGNKPTPSFNFNNPFFCKSNNERPPFVGSFGIIIVLSFFNSERLFIFLEYPAIGYTNVFPIMASL